MRVETAPTGASDRRLFEWHMPCWFQRGLRAVEPMARRDGERVVDRCQPDVADSATRPLKQGFQWKKC